MHTGVCISKYGKLGNSIHHQWTNINYTTSMFSLPLDMTEYFRNYSGCCIMLIRMWVVALKSSSACFINKCAKYSRPKLQKLCWTKTDTYLVSIYVTRRHKEHYCDRKWIFTGTQCKSSAQKSSIQTKALLIVEMIKIHQGLFEAGIRACRETKLLKTWARDTHSALCLGEGFQYVPSSRSLHNIIKQFKLALLTQALNAAVSWGGKSHQGHPLTHHTPPLTSSVYVDW